MYFDTIPSGGVAVTLGLDEASFSPDCTSSGLSRGAARVRASLAKRCLDIVGAALLLALTSPVMLMIALAIKLEGRGPVFFFQQRYGVDRTIFKMVKFRSMTVLETHGAFQQVGVGDERITKVGRMLRRTSLDELPQLFNVLSGEMSLVGPRPHAVAMDDAFATLIPNYLDRHAVRPGITGLAQIAGLRGPTDGTEKMLRRLRRDRAYIRCWSIWTDLKILALTPLRVFGPNAF